MSLRALAAAWVIAWAAAASALAQAPAGSKGWMAVKDSPAKAPGPCPWMVKKDSPEQAALRRELAGAGRIVFASDRDGNWEIYSCNPDGSDQKNLTNNAAWDFYPRWTPDGKGILFFSDRGAPVRMAEFYDQLMERLGTGPWGYYHNDVSWSTPWRREREMMSASGVYRMDADGSNVTLLVKNAQYANLSPDGRRLVFERYGKSVAHVLADGAEFAAVRKYWIGSWWPEYSPDGSRILVATTGDVQGSHEASQSLMATIFDLKPDGRATGVFWNLQLGNLTPCPRWRPDGNGLVIVQGSRETRLQEIDLTEGPDKFGWRTGKTIGLAAPADRWMHSFPAYCPAGKYIAFSLSPIHYLVRDIKAAGGVELKNLGYKPWKEGNQIAWQELCVGRSVPGQDNVYVQLTEGGFANRDADWWVPPDRRIRPAAPITAASVRDEPLVEPMKGDRPKPPPAAK